jgi:hypothetical protein
MDIERAYEIGRSAAAREPDSNKIHEPLFALVHAARTAEALASAFWRGVRDQRKEG